MYLRISKSEKKDTKESDSIANQRKIILKYIHEHDELEIIQEWLDDGMTGSNFCRPGIQKLLFAAKQHTIDCVIVKDLSRFGREYIQTGYYIQEFFPQNGIRFISVCDQFDSLNSVFMESSLLLPIMNILNDGYCQDISKKVRWQQEVKRKDGDFIGAFCTYGYEKEKENTNHLVIDKPAAKTVGFIFLWYLQGKSAAEIARELNRRGICSPYAYKKSKSSHYHTSFARSEKPLWSAVAVRRILDNEMYTGVLLQGKSRKINYKLQKRVLVPKEEWIRVEGVVPAIISKEMFQKVQKLRERRKKTE